MANITGNSLHHDCHLVRHRELVGAIDGQPQGFKGAILQGGFNAEDG